MEKIKAAQRRASSTESTKEMSCSSGGGGCGQRSDCDLRPLRDHRRRRAGCERAGAPADGITEIRSNDEDGTNGQRNVRAFRPCFFTGFVDFSRNYFVAYLIFSIIIDGVERCQRGDLQWKMRENTCQRYRRLPGKAQSFPGGIIFPGAGLSVSGPGDPRGGNQRKGICLRLPLIHSPGIRISCGNIYFSPSEGHPGADLSGRELIGEKAFQQSFKKVYQVWKKMEKEGITHPPFSSTCFIWRQPGFIR